MMKNPTEWRIRTVNGSNEEGGKVTPMPIDEAETKRVDAEKKREESENSRRISEFKRVDAESIRESAEAKRSSAEKVRENAESNREREEKKRYEEEIRRQVQEELRQKEDERRKKEEEARKKEEEEHRIAEKIRKQEEEKRKREEEERKKKEEERKEKEAAYRESLKNRAIVFRIGEETNIVVAKTHQQIEHSPLKEQYAQALRIVDDILAQSSDNENKENGYTAISNIVAFCGDRGEGKTSALMTTREILLGGTTFEEARKANILPVDRHFKESTFKVLRLVDPAFFDSNHNLLELLIGQMYADIMRADKEAAEKGESNICGMNDNVAMRKRLLQSFQNVRSSLGIINRPSDKSAYDNLEEIDELAIGIALREKVDELMYNYAKYFQKERVLICVDDLDLNVSEGYKMAEEIRKYLCNPRVCIILMSIKVEQMIEVVQSYLRIKMAKDIIPDSTITEMAVRYVTKLLPTPHRVVMPKGEGIVELPVVIEDKKSNEPPFESVKDAIVKLIYRKTRYVFVNGRNLSPIVPTNLRSIRHLVGLLWEMSDISRDEITPENTSNKVLFKNYFYYTWTNQLRTDDQVFIREFVANEDLTSLNKSVVQHLSAMFEKRYEKEEKTNRALDLLAAIRDNRNTIYNVSVGDVMYMVRYMESIATDKQDLYFLFFIKAFYSIKLYETYDFITSDEKNLFVKPESEETAKYIYKYDKQIQKMNQLQRLLNGSYFTYVPGTLLPAERDMRTVDGNLLIKLIQSLPENAADCINEYRDVLRLCEFFIMTTSRPLYADEHLEYDRKRINRGYFEEFSATNNDVIFDIMSIFYNVVNIKYTYQRWNKICKATDFYEYAKEVHGYKEKQDTKEVEVKGSLLNEILSEHASHYKDPAGENIGHELHAFLSDAIIRISDIIFSIWENAESQKDVHGDGNNAKNIYNLFNDIDQIGICLYPISQDDGGYPLPFDFLKPITRWLISEASNNSEFDLIFDNVNKRKKEDSLTKDNVILPITNKLSSLSYPRSGHSIAIQISNAVFPESKARRKMLKNELLADTFDKQQQYQYDAVKKKFNEIFLIYTKVALLSK